MTVYAIQLQRTAYSIRLGTCSIQLQHTPRIQHMSYMYSRQHTAYRIYRTLTWYVSQFMIMTVYESGHGPSHKSINMILAVCETNFADVVHQINP